MKKQLLLTGIITLTSLSVIVGCDNSNTSNSSIVDSSQEVTSFDSIGSMLHQLRKGVKLSGEVNQTSTFLKSHMGEPNGTEMSNKYNVSFTYQSEGQNAYAGYASTELETGEEYVYIDNVAFEGEDGFAYYYDLNYDNEVAPFPYYDLNGREYVNFGYYYTNPFNFIMEEDFIKVRDNTYHLTKDKANLFASSVLGDIDPAFFEVNKVCEFKLENGMIKTIKVVPSDVYDYSINYETFEETYYLLTQEAVLTVEKFNNVRIAKPEKNTVPEESKDAIAKLQTALDKFDAKNFTLEIKGEFLDENNSKYFDTATYYFTGEELYLSFSEDQSAPNEEKDYYFHKENGRLVPAGYVSEEDKGAKYAFSNDSLPRELTLNNSYSYDELVPVIGDVNAEIFNYNKKFDFYSIAECMVSYIGSLAFIPKLNKYSYYLSDSGTKLNLRINSNADIDYIDYNYYYNDYFFFEDAELRITFKNVGTTVIPHNIFITE